MRGAWLAYYAGIIENRRKIADKKIKIHLRVLSTTRVSLGVYNTEEEIQAFLTSLAGIRRQMGYGE